jgi:hypothetical protein
MELNALTFPTLTIANITMKRFNIRSQMDKILYEENNANGDWCRYEDVLAGELENRTYWLSIADLYINKSIKNTSFWRITALTCFSLFLATFVVLIEK